MALSIRRKLLLSLAALALASWACTSQTASGPQYCDSDADCAAAGMICDTSFSPAVCRTPCTTSADCPPELLCVSGLCLRSCEQDDECPAGEHCQAGFCRPLEPQDAGSDGDADGGGGECTDADGDGYGPGDGRGCPLGGGDCDDNERSIYPGAPEICHDGKDNDCDGDTDEDDCGCQRGDRRACYTGHIDTLGVGLCHGGVMICGDDKEYGPCLGERTPEEEVCDGEDNDCDGDSDEGLLNRCGQCSPPDDQLQEVCGDGLDNDCDDQVDEDCSCDPDCHCDDPGAGSNCQCHPPVDQPCYEGPWPTLGVGICRGGTHDCVEQGGGYAWTSCQGQVLPMLECAGGQADGLDNDCDGFVDEDCLPDGDGDGYTRPDDCDDSDPAVHPGAAESCNGTDDNCNGIIDEGVTNACGDCGTVPDEVCADGLDNDCDGQVDENCGGCSSDSKPCYRGPDGTQGVGDCAWGQMFCVDGEFWSECQGDVVPQEEVCDGADNDCDGETDERWAVGSNACGWCQTEEVCDGIDNDCDGWIDEGVANACGECGPAPEEVCDGVDNDCDGLIDEGVLTACGTCPDVPCYEQGWDAPGDCDADLRDCDGVEPDPGDPDSVTLGQGTVRTPFIYISVTQVNQVAKLDTETGQKIWQVDSHGKCPSRTAVALDFSVWVGNRAAVCGSYDYNNPDNSNGVHLDADGNLICRVDAVGICRGVAIDGNGNVWFGTYAGQTLYQVSGSEVDDTSCSRPPCCKLLRTVPVGVSVYGLAIDGNGYLWTASSPETVKVDTATGNIVSRVSNPTFYGIAIDQNNNVWLGGWSGGGYVHRIDGATHQVWNTSVNNVTAVTVDQDGFIWGSSYGTNEVVKIDPSTGQKICSAPVQNGTNPHGVAVDAAGKIWVPNRYGGYANRFLSDCTFDGSFPVDPGKEMYTYSDMTGMQLRMVTTRQGHWIQNFDSGYADAIWHSATWEATVPANTSVQVTFVSADSEAELANNHSPPCGPFTSSPADLLSCPGLQGHRWLSADVQLNTTQDGVRPTFSNLHVFWSH